MNIKLLLRVADHIDEFPDSFHLETWADRAPDANICDTIGCVAGWVVMIQDPEVRVALMSDPNFELECFPWEQTAARHLGISDTEGTVLFTANRWWAERMLELGLEPDRGWDEGDEGCWVSLDAVPAKAASTILRELAAGRISLNFVWNPDD